MKRKKTKERSAHVVHGFSGKYRTPEYMAWVAMRARCNCPTNKAYKMYGGRGVKVCERWNKFKVFLADMGPRPSSKHSLDRRNPFGNYEPDNCGWGTIEEQGRNRRNVRNFTLGGKTLILAEWCRIKRIPYERVRQRLKRGIPFERAIA